MLEILAIYFFCKNVGNTVRDKGRKPIGYQLLTVGMWFGGEVFGAIIGVLLFGLHSRSIDPVVYLSAIIGALLGGFGGLMIAASLSPVRKESAGLHDSRFPLPHDLRQRS